MGFAGDVRGLFAYEDYVYIGSGNAVDVYWEVGRIYILDRWHTIWLLQEMGFFIIEDLSFTVRQRLVYGDPRCASRVLLCITFFFYIYEIV